LIPERFGPNYLPEKPNYYKSKKDAQEAHEAVRPTDATRAPEDVRKYLDEDLFKLYQLIWQRFVASQMLRRSSIKRLSTFPLATTLSGLPARCKNSTAISVSIRCPRRSPIARKTKR